MKTKFLTTIFIPAFLLGALLLAGCGSGSKDSGNDKVKTNDYSVTDQKDAEEPGEINDAKNEAPGSSQQGKSKDGSENSPVVYPDSISMSETVVADDITGEESTEKIIKNAEISMEVSDFKQTRKEILSEVKAFGAEVKEENQTSTGSSKVDDITIRVKPESFDSLVEKILDLGLSIEYSKISSDDATDVYLDAEAQIKAKEEAEAKYKEILKKTYGNKEVQAIQEKINRLRTDIDGLKGKSKDIDTKASYSTIKVHFYQTIDESASPESGFSYKFGKAFNWGWSGLQEFFIWFIYLWPFWTITLISLYLLFFFIKRRQKRNAVK